TAARALSYIGLISTFTMIAFGPVGDRFNKRILLTCFLLAHTLLLFWLINIHGKTSLWGFVACFGILLGAFWPLTVSILSDVFGSQNVGSILGACTLAYGLAGVTAPWMAGHIFDLYKSYDRIFYFCILLSAASVICAYNIRKTRNMP
ncbi:MFS transporter, partial [Thermodesulfobacteriota bacterium]